MFKVKINCVFKESDDLLFETEMPIMPKKGDFIGVWDDEQWVVLIVDNVIYEFTEVNTYSIAEVNLIESE